MNRTVCAVVTAMLLATVSPIAAQAGGRGAGSVRPPEIRDIVEAFAKSSVESGTSIGVAVGVTLNGHRQVFGYGVADVASGERVSPRTIFQIGSVTKIFTTALLAQEVLAGNSSLTQTLRDFTPELGAPTPSAAAVTLRELGDFTAGYPSLPELCSAGMKPGCLPSDRPTIDQYGAADLAAYFRFHEVPAKLPAPYLYSDFSTGLIGLLLGATPGRALDNSAVDGWLALVDQRIVDPLKMRDTLLDPDDATQSQKRRFASGYQQALAQAIVSASGEVMRIEPVSVGVGYIGVPAVAVRGGGGLGARAHALLDPAGGVKSYVVDSRGGGYVAPASVTFSGPHPATAQAIIADGEVVALRITDGGSGYAQSAPPTVTLAGGTAGRNQRNAVAGKVTVSNGAVVFVEVADGGRGYVDPIAVVVDAGAPAINTIPVWAPAGALSSTVEDMLTLVDVSLGHLEGVDKRKAASLQAGLRLAQQSFACQSANAQGRCYLGSGLAWSIAEADGDVPAIVSKNGGINGYSSEVRIVPALDLGVVVLVNSRQTLFDDQGQPTRTADNIAESILFAILHGGL